MTNHENGRKTKYLTLGLIVVSDGLVVDLFILGDALLEILQGCFFVHDAKISTTADLELGVLLKKLFVVTDTLYKHHASSFPHSFGRRGALFQSPGPPRIRRIRSWHQKWQSCQRPAGVNTSRRPVRHLLGPTTSTCP
jgi:hypothetical protein